MKMIPCLLNLLCTSAQKNVQSCTVNFSPFVCIFPLVIHQFILTFNYLANMPFHDLDFSSSTKADSPQQRISRPDPDLPILGGRAGLNHSMSVHSCGAGCKNFPFSLSRMPLSIWYLSFDRWRLRPDLHQMCFWTIVLRFLRPRISF